MSKFPLIASLLTQPFAVEGFYAQHSLFDLIVLILCLLPLMSSLRQHLLFSARAVEGFSTEYSSFSLRRASVASPSFFSVSSLPDVFPITNFVMFVIVHAGLL